MPKAHFSQFFCWHRWILSDNILCFGCMQAEFVAGLSCIRKYDAIRYFYFTYGEKAVDQSSLLEKENPLTLSSVHLKAIAFTVHHTFFMSRCPDVSTGRTCKLRTERPNPGLLAARQQCQQLDHRAAICMIKCI